MNWFDLNIMHFSNSFAQRSSSLDSAFALAADNNFLVGGVLVTAFWWAWIKFGKESTEKRETLLFGLIATGFSVVVARVLALSLPFRERPLHNSLLHFRLPFGADPDSLINWSSFPSDHAVVCFCLAASLWFVSRRLGTLALIYAFVISLPRVYMGIHYPTDILAGALVGIGVAALCNIAPLRRSITHFALSQLEMRPAYFFAALFAYTFELGEMFDSLRDIAFATVKSALKHSYLLRANDLATSLMMAGALFVSVPLIWRAFGSFRTSTDVRK